MNGTPWVLQPDTWVGALGSWSVEFEDGSYMRAQTGTTTVGPASWALIVTSPSGPYGGAVYCASGGRIDKTEGAFGSSIMQGVAAVASGWLTIFADLERGAADDGRSERGPPRARRGEPSNGGRAYMPSPKKRQFV